MLRFLPIVLALVLAGCAGGFAISGQSSAKKVGSKCYIKQTGDKYLEGRYRQVSEGEIVCIEEKDQP